MNVLVILTVVCAIRSSECVRFPERRDAPEDEGLELEVDDTRSTRALGPGGFVGGILDTTADGGFTQRGRGRRPSFQTMHSIAPPSRDYELLVNLLVRNNSQWDAAAAAAGEGDPRRFQDRLTAMLGEMIPQSCWYRGDKYDCALSLTCMLGSRKPLDLCSGGMIWSCCVPHHKLVSAEVSSPAVAAIENATLDFLLNRPLATNNFYDRPPYFPNGGGHGPQAPPPYRPLAITTRRPPMYKYEHLEHTCLYLDRHLDLIFNLAIHLPASCLPLAFLSVKNFLNFRTLAFFKHLEATCMSLAKHFAFN